MQFSIRTDSPASTDCVILPIFQQAPLTSDTKKFDKATRGRIAKAVRSGDAAGRPGQTLLLRDADAAGAKHILLVGCGDKDAFDAKALSRALSAAAIALANSSIRSVASFLATAVPRELDAHTAARTTVVTFRDANYRFDEFKSKPEPATSFRRVAIVIGARAARAEARSGVREGTAIANGIDLAKDLGNRPPNVCTPSHIASTARALARDNTKLKARVFTESEIVKLGMGAMMAVTRGAKEPPRFVILEYTGGPRGSAPVALCGKGVTFDTGGISLKPPPKMDEMKFDMCGAAAVIGTMRAVAELELPINVVALVPACENMPGSEATRPGDIVKSLSGQTVEILNTDAEGRLILCDAIAYAHRYEPRCIIDVATLTGACVVALGAVYSAVFSRDETLAADLLAAGSRALDAAWRMPVDEEYGESLKSNFADFANSGGREGGASVAAQFLSRFVDGVPWAHLDIAGVAWKQNAAKGATGRPVGLLVDFLLNAAA